MQSAHSHRKDEHVSLAEKFRHLTTENDFDQVQIRHDALPEIALNEISTHQTVGQFHLSFPMYIEAMTGGSERTQQLNTKLAQVAAACDLPMATGSQSVALKDASLVPSFQVVRQQLPQGLVFGNLGANHSLQAARAAVKMLNADALQLHLNVVQEAVMPEGDQDFHWLANLELINRELNVPVIAKEVGFGISEPTLDQLYAAGVRYLDLGGHGGTNFVEIENARRPRHDFDYLKSFGLSTVQSLLAVHQHPADLAIIASGGIRQPLDMLKAIMLGADAVGVAEALLHQVIHADVEVAINFVKQWQIQFRLLMAIVGAKSIADLQKQSQKLIFSPTLESYWRQLQQPLL